MASHVVESVFVPSVLRACDYLIKKSHGHLIFTFVLVGVGNASRLCLLPQMEIEESEFGFSREDVELYEKWVRERRYVVFMYRSLAERFPRPLLDLRNGKLVLISHGGRVVTKLE